MKLVLCSIFLLILLILLSKHVKESFDTQNDKKINDKLDDIIRYIGNSIDSRKNAGKTSKFYNEKYQKQILALTNALNYATYIQKNII